ncbi:DUF6326 family protein [Flavobacterium sp. AJR]|uniref:DUF6326 family protein n=1 Tax=Flavobacterium sp. AJR TaxID=1979369 RepID=UPI000A3D6748|nr:DUF6326 family protein [Flavobacterium sp. AJR]OUL60417.1 hypothetical protein B8T70_20435 [Flavobacterium sp. AJR]
MSAKEINTSRFEDFKVNVRIKLSALWASVMFCYIYGDYFSLYVPNKIQGFVSGDNMLDNPIKLFAATILMVIPSLMIFLSILLKPKLARLLNIIFGIIYTAIMLLIAATTLAPWWAFYVFLALVESTITILIVWQAYKWPRLV